MTKTKCFHCKSTEYIRKGFRITENRGKIQKYLCLKCKRYFTNDDGFYRMRNNERIITKAIDLYFSNLSSRKVRNQFKRHENTKASHVSVLDWCRRYTLKVQKYVDNLVPKVSGQFYADDTEINRQGQKDHFWVSVDWGTRFISAIHYSTLSGAKEASYFLEKAGKHLPKYIQTDAANFYPHAFSRMFNKHRSWKIEHRIQNVYKTGQHNVRIETVFMKIKDRVDDFRGLKALWSAPILLNGIVLQHNFIEEHMTTKQVPCELASLRFLEEANNRWLNLIRRSAIIG